MRWHVSQDRECRTRIYVTCEDPACANRHQLAARLGDPGHQPGDTVYLICGGCERILAAVLTAGGAVPARR